LIVCQALGTLGLVLARPNHDWFWQCVKSRNAEFGVNQT